MKMKMVCSSHTHPKGPVHKHLKEPVQESQQAEEYCKYIYIYMFIYMLPQGRHIVVLVEHEWVLMDPLYS